MPWTFTGMSQVFILSYVFIYWKGGRFLLLSEILGSPPSFTSSTTITSFIRWIIFLWSTRENLSTSWNEKMELVFPLRLLLVHPSVPAPTFTCSPRRGGPPSLQPPPPAPLGPHRGGARTLSSSETRPKHLPRRRPCRYQPS